MANETNALVAGSGGTGGVVLTPMSEYVGMAMQEYYSYVNNTTFFNLVTAQMRPFYRKVQNWSQWINGFVPTFHNFTRGVMPTHLAKAIVDKVSALIYGGGILFEADGAEQDNHSETLDFVSDWVKCSDFKNVIQDALRQAAGLGTAALKLNFSRGEKVWVESVPLNRSFYSMSGSGEVLSAKFYIKAFTKTYNNGKDDSQYALVEERYYKTEDGQRKPYARYKLYSESVQVNQFSAPSAPISWETTPHWLREALKTDYSGLMVDREIRLPLTSLGVYLVKWTPSLSSMPGLKYGDSVLEGIIKYLCEFDILSSIMDTEMYTGRARAYATKAVTNKRNGNNAVGTYNEGLDNMITFVETMNTDGEPLKFFQPNMRAEEIKSMRNTLLENIATAIGISPSSFASYLQDQSARTAREISSEESATTLFVENKREVILTAINDLLHDLTNYYGKVDDVVARFSKAGQTNYNLLIENTLKLYQGGLMDLRSAVATVNPQMDNEQIDKIVEAIREEQEQKRAEEQNSMFGNMDFGSEINAPV